MQINDFEEQFKNNPTILSSQGNLHVIVGGNNSGKSTILRSIIKTETKEKSYLVNVNRTVLTGEGSMNKNYQENYSGYLTNVLTKNDDNFQRQTQPLQDFFNLNDNERDPIIKWYNQYFPNPIIEERENPLNSASPLVLKVNGHPITKQGSGIRATLEIFIALFNPIIKILCIDEPELGLEPYLQKYLFNALKSKASPDKLIVLATHSHHFLDLDKPDNNYICQRDGNNKIFLTPVEDLQPVIFRLLGNTLSGFLLPEKLIVLEGTSDTTYIYKCLHLLGKNGFAIHNSGGNGNIKYAINSITQFLKFNHTNLTVYKNNVFVIADKPTPDINIREWETLLGNASRINKLTKNGIEYYYPEHILHKVFQTNESKDIIIDEYLIKNPNSYNNITISKNSLAVKVSEIITYSDLSDPNNELFEFLNALP